MSEVEAVAVAADEATVEDGGLAGAPSTESSVRAKSPKVTRVVAARLPLGQRLVELWRHRELFVFLVRKDIKVRYKGSVLGFFWSMLNPAFNLAIYYFVFALVFKNNIPDFVVFLFCGMLAWNVFSTGVMGGTGSIVGNGAIVKKVSFPREILALSNVGSAFMFLVFQSTVMVFFMLVLLHPPAWADIWLLVPAIAAMLMFTSAVAVVLSAVNVYLRDTAHFVEIGLAAWFWAVPTIYSYNITLLPHFLDHATKAKTILKGIYLADPMTPVILSFQRVIYGQHSVQVSPGKFMSVLPAWPVGQFAWMDAVVFAASTALFLGAMVIFGRLQGNFAEEL